MDMFDFLNWQGDGFSCRLATCIDDLGTAKRLKVLDDTGLELETDKGLFTLDVRAWEPAWDYLGFVGVKLPRPVNGRTWALYFDPRITATLLDARFLWSHGERAEYRSGKMLKLYSEETAWMTLRRMPFDDWAAGVVCSELTWVDISGAPIIEFETKIPDLEQKLWKLVQSPIPNQEELAAFGVDGYIEERNRAFLRGRFSHYKALMKFQEQLRIA